ncbi:beta strand repeat-containing protein, partial [Bartonella bovis]|uniref:beta strand repeat-containing protein n=1 Tax=Bartonella bovis TaxID=155194 RepID=UPI001ABB5317
MWVMVMRCVFKHHVYLCVVSTALMAGLSLITSHTSKAYADQNCGSSRGGGVKVVGDVVGPIVCDSRETRTLNSRSGGDIEINMDRGRGSKEAAVTVTGQGTNITIMKKLKITGTGKASVMGMGKTMTVTKGGGIQMDGTGTADVMGLTIMGSGGMGVDMQGTGTMELNKVNVSGFTMGVNAMSGKVNINGNSTITVTNSGTVILNGVAISGFGKGVYATGAGTLTISGGTTIQFTGGSGNYGVKVENGVTANITGATIRGTSGQGTGVIKDGTKMMTMTDVTISGVKVGVEVKKGTVDMMGGTVTFEGGSGYGVQVQNGATANLTKVTIKGTGSGQGTGLYVMGTLKMSGGSISNVESGVYATGTGTLNMDGTTITFKNGDRNYGVKVESGVTMASLTNVTITGTGSGAGSKGVIKEGAGKWGDVEGDGGTVTFTGGSGNYGVRVGSSKTLNMINVDISQVKVGIEVTSGNLTVSGGTMTDVGMGIRMLGKGTLKISGGTTITVKDGVGNYGIGVGESVNATITGTTITGTSGGTGKGVWMESSGKMTLTKVEISDVAMGVEATNGTLEIKGHSRIMFTSGAGNYGVRVKNGVTSATLTDVTIEGTSGNGEGSKGVIVGSDEVGATGTMTMERVTISNVEKGVWMNGGTVTMNNVQISKVKMGVEATNGKLTIKGHSRIMFTSGAGNYGVRVGSGVTMATLTDVTITGKGGQGTGVIVGSDEVGATGTMTMERTMERVTISNVEKGVEAKKGGTLTINKGKIGFKKDYGIGVWGTATATITGTTIRGAGKGKGVYATGMGKLTLTMTGVNISNVAMGIEATNGTLTIKGHSVITFNNGNGNYGIGVGKSVTLANITGTRITGSGSGKGTGVIMDGTGTLTMTGVNISNVSEGVWGSRGTLKIKDGSITVTNSGFKGYGVGVYVG